MMVWIASHENSISWSGDLDKRRRLDTHNPGPNPRPFAPESVTSPAGTPDRRCWPRDQSHPPAAVLLAPPATLCCQKADEAQRAAEVLAGLRSCQVRTWRRPQPCDLHHQRQQRYPSHQPAPQHQRAAALPHGQPQPQILQQPRMQLQQSSSAPASVSTLQRPNALPTVTSCVSTGISDGLLQAEPWGFAGSGRGGMGVVTGSAAPCRRGGATVTTGAGAAVSGGIITTGVVTTRGAAAAAMGAASANMAAIAGGGNASTGARSANVMTGCGPASRARTLKRRLSASWPASDSTPTPISAPAPVPAPAPAPALPAPPVPSGVKGTITCPQATTSSPQPPASLRLGAPALSALMTDSAAPVFQAAEVVTSHNPQHAGLEDESAPSTPPRTPGSRVAAQAVPQAVSAPAAPHPRPQLRADLTAQLIAQLNAQLALMAGTQPFITHSTSAAPQLLGFRMAGVEVAAGPHTTVTAPAGCEVTAPKRQVVQVRMQLSPLVSKTNSGEAAACEAVCSAAISPSPVGPQLLPMQQPAATEAPFVGLQSRPLQHGSEALKAKEAIQHLQGFREQEAARVLPGQKRLPRSASCPSERMREWAPSAICTWLPAGASPSEPALPGLERLMAAAAAATDAAAFTARTLVPCPSKLPSLPLPALNSEAYYEPDGSLLRGAVLKTACNIVRVAKTLRAGVTMTLPWAEVDGAATAAPSPAPGRSPATHGLSTAASSPSSQGRCGQGPSGLGLSGGVSAWASAASGPRTIPLAAVLKVLADFAGACRALQIAEARDVTAHSRTAAGAPAGAAAAAVAAADDYRALWPLMGLGHKCAEALMARVERALIGETAGTSLSPSSSVTTVRA